MRHFVVERAYLEAVARGWQELPETLYKHAIRSLRMREGDAAELRADALKLEVEFTRQARLWGVRATGEQTVRDRPDEVEVHVVPAVFKAQRFRWMIEKLVELGATSISPFRAERSGPHDARSGDGDRWRRIAEEATRQSGGIAVPDIAEPTSLTDALDGLPDDVQVLLAVPDAAISVPPTAPGYALVTGPEGGLTATEIALCAERGAVTVSLGPRILRAETAPLAMLAALRLFRS